MFDGGAGEDRTVVNGSTGDDTLVVHPGTATLTGNNYAVSIANTETIIVLGEGGNDHAELYDSSGDDQFVAGFDDGVSYADLYGSGFYNRAEDFESVYAYATASETDTDTAKFYDSPREGADG